MKVRPRVPVESGAPLPLPDPMKQQVTKTNAAAAEAPREPTASLTEPESRWMKATSRKRWEPCFNADICITTDGIIVSQFLTQENTDYHNFSPSLDFVLATLGTPPRWVGDGHYGTAENLQTANSHGVLLYAPRRGLETESDSTSEQSINDTVRSSEPPNSSTRTGTDDSRFRNRDFKQGHQEDVLLCPAGETLRFIGEYPNDASRGGTYRLYGRSDCSDCALKERCTTGQGRRVRRLQHLGQRGPPPEATSTREDALTSPRAHDLPAADLPQLIDDLQKRMLTDGKELMRIRGQTIEPTNAQLKLHGLGRFHVHGLARCGIVLTIACLAHNLMKWAARQTTQKLAAI